MIGCDEANWNRYLAANNGTVMRGIGCISDRWAHRWNQVDEPGEDRGTVGVWGVSRDRDSCWTDVVCFIARVAQMEEKMYICNQRQMCYLIAFAVDKFVLQVGGLKHAAWEWGSRPNQKFSTICWHYCSKSPPNTYIVLKYILIQE